jgi:hypothetical protein
MPEHALYNVCVLHPRKNKYLIGRLYISNMESTIFIWFYSAVQYVQIWEYCQVVGVQQV